MNLIRDGETILDSIQIYKHDKSMQLYWNGKVFVNQEDTGTGSNEALSLIHHNSFAYK